MAESVWKQARQRARREALDFAKLDTPIKALSTVGAPVAAISAAWLVTGQLAVATLAGLAALFVFALSLYLVKLVRLPAKIADERQTEIDRMTAEKATAEGLRRHNLIRRLTELYKFSSDGFSSELAAGLALPPKDWLNEQLEMRGEHWSIYEIRGTDYWTFEVTGPAPQASA